MRLIHLRPVFNVYLGGQNSFLEWVKSVLHSGLVQPCQARLLWDPHWMPQVTTTQSALWLHGEERFSFSVSGNCLASTLQVVCISFAEFAAIDMQPFAMKILKETLYRFLGIFFMNSTLVSWTLPYIALSLQLYYVQSPSTAGSGWEPPPLLHHPKIAFREKIRV